MTESYVERYLKIESEENTSDDGEIRNAKQGLKVSMTEVPVADQSKSDTTKTSESFHWTVPLQITVSISAPQPLSGVADGMVPTRFASPEGKFSSSPPASESGNIDIGSFSPNRFSWQTAFSTALASKLAYETESSIMETTIDQWGFSECQSIDVDDTQCFLAASNEFAILSFRGTENLGDWLANINMLSTTRDYGKVHRGFLGAFNVVRSELESLLSDLNGRPLLLMGHSLGGALATIAAAQWLGKVFISGVYTFGQPGVGKNSFPEFMNHNYRSRFYRFVNDDDIVPRVPPTYRHVGKLFHFDSRGNLEGGFDPLTETVDGLDARETEMMTEAEFDRLRSELHAGNALAKGSSIEMPETQLAEGLLPSVSDHGMDRYLEKIKQMI